MANQTYSEKLKNPLWQKKRLEILNRDNFTGVLCSDTETELHIHHKEYKWGNKPWEYPEDNFQTLCKRCHKIVEYFKDYNLTPLISSKYQMVDDSHWVISTIFKESNNELTLAMNYYSDDTNKLELITLLSNSEFKGISTLFSHAEKLFK